MSRFYGSLCIRRTGWVESWNILFLP